MSCNVVRPSMDIVLRAPACARILDVYGRCVHLCFMSVFNHPATVFRAPRRHPQLQSPWHIDANALYCSCDLWISWRLLTLNGVMTADDRRPHPRNYLCGSCRASGLSFCCENSGSCIAIAVKYFWAGKRRYQFFAPLQDTHWKTKKRRLDNIYVRYLGLYLPAAKRLAKLTLWILCRI